MSAVFSCVFFLFRNTSPALQKKKKKTLVEKYQQLLGEKKPFSGLAISYHENGKRRSQTTVKDGVAYGLIEEWDENGTRLGANFKDEFKRRK